MSKKVIAVVVLASIAIVGIWYVAVFSSQSHSIHKARLEAAALNDQAGTIRSRISLLEQEKTQLPAATAKLSTLQLALPATPALDKLIDDINNAAAKTGVNWENITPTKPATYTPGEAATEAFPGGMQAVPVSMEVDGSYQQVTSFVTQLMGLSRLLDVNGVSLSEAPGKTTAQLSTEVFFIPPTASTPTTVAP